VLNQHYPNANNPQMAVELSVPEPGWTLVEILDPRGNKLEVISNAICEPGYHMAAWNRAKYASGSCKYRLRYNGGKSRKFPASVTSQRLSSTLKTNPNLRLAGAFAQTARTFHSG
jgi:hypothetical protein